MTDTRARARFRDRVATVLREHHVRRLEHAKRANDHQRERERRGEVGKHGKGENGGWSSA